MTYGIFPSPEIGFAVGLIFGVGALLGVDFSLSTQELSLEEREEAMPELPSSLAAAFNDALTAKADADAKAKAKSDTAAALVDAQQADDAAQLSLNDSAAKLETARVALDSLLDAYLRPGQTAS